MMGRALAIAAAALALSAAGTATAAKPPKISLDRDDANGVLTVGIDGAPALTYHHGRDVDLPYFVPRAPSGRALTVVHPEKYPHHRSVWFADTLRLGDRRKVSFYNAWYTRIDKKDPHSPFRDRVRHVAFEKLLAADPGALLDARLLWEMDRDKPVLDEARRMRFTALGRGEWLLDVTFTLTASYGDVHFVSDAVHYAWPYVRMSPTYAVKGGGRMVSSAGGVNQKGTHDKRAAWVDYTNTVEGATEGLAVLCPVAAGAAARPRWLTRDYGTFGPRRPDERSGKPFTLAKGKSLSTRVGLLIHRGDVEGGRVAARHAAYVAGLRAEGADR